MSLSTRRFVLEALDNTTECPIEEVAFEVDDIDQLCTIVGTNVADIDRFSYEPELEQVARLKLRFKVAFEPGSRIVRLRAHSRFRARVLVHGHDRTHQVTDRTETWVTD